MNETTTTNGRKKDRTYRILTPIAPNGQATVRITQRLSKNRVEQTIYQLTTFEAYQGEGIGVAFAKPEGETYHVYLNEAGHATCDCKGHTRHGHCKHADLTAALSQRGELRLPIQENSEVDPWDIAEAALSWEVADAY